MPKEIVRHLSLEEQELARKLQELAMLQAELIDRELLLANLRAELAVFEGRYLREVGGLYAELDDWNAKIAELDAEADGSVGLSRPRRKRVRRRRSPMPPLMVKPQTWWNSHHRRS